MRHGHGRARLQLAFASFSRVQTTDRVHDESRAESAPDREPNPHDPAGRSGGALPAAAQPPPTEWLCATKRRALELVQAGPNFKVDPRKNRLLAWF